MSRSSSWKSLARVTWSVAVAVRDRAALGAVISCLKTAPCITGLILGDKIVDTRSECAFYATSSCLMLPQMMLMGSPQLYRALLCRL